MAGNALLPMRCKCTIQPQSNHHIVLRTCQSISELRYRDNVPVEWFAITLSLPISNPLATCCEHWQHITFTFFQWKKSLFLQNGLQLPYLCPSQTFSPLCPACCKPWQHITFTFFQWKKSLFRQIGLQLPYLSPYLMVFYLPTYLKPILPMQCPAYCATWQLMEGRDYHFHFLAKSPI